MSTPAAGGSRIRPLGAHALLLFAALLACHGAAHPGPLHNRDLHGPADVAHYIRMLESPRRLQYLRPDLVVETLAPAPDAVVADLGSGPGVFALRLARACPRGVVYAVDVEPRQLDALRARMSEQSIHNIVPVLASYDDPHLPLRRMDLILIANTYHHLTDRVAYLSRLRDVLRSGGRLAILEYRPGDLPVGPPPERKLREGVREAELSEAGWERVRSFDTHPYHEFEIWRVAPPSRR